MSRRVPSSTPVPPAGLAARIVAWQRDHGRHDLPWQGTREPYRVWLSEVMLQQTQVTTVRDYYARFLLRFPDVQSLAAASLDEVLGLWSGLGYYSRARNLHRCAQAVVTEHGGRFPGDSRTLATLPGIGRSTAAAIAAFCFGERAAILDGNVKRVLTRVLGFDGDLAEAAQERALWALAEALLPDEHVDVYTQALMDLGATVCLTRQPLCLSCPVQAECVARREGRPADFPVKTRRLKRGSRSHALLWLRWREQVLLVQRPGKGVWAGLFSLPEWDRPETLQAVSAGWPGKGEALPVVEHALTHFDWTLRPLRWTLPEKTPAAQLAVIASEAVSPGGPGRWFTLEEAAAMGLPAPVRKLLMG